MSEHAQYRFPTTRWTLVERAGEQGSSGADALGQLLTRYLSPLRAHLVLQKRLPPQQVDDLLQGFISDKVLDRDLVGGAVREKGRFRTFLLVALDRYVSDQARSASRKRRSPDGQVSLQEAPDAADPTPSPSGVFEAAWARQVLANAAQLMREECDASGRPDVWAVFEGRVLYPTLEGAQPVPYSQLVERLSLASVDAASNLLITAKRMFARRLRAVVGEYMGEDGEVEQEIADLRAILGRSRD